MRNKPVRKVERAWWEKLVDIISFCILFVSFIYIIFVWNDLPEKMPIHFNFSGEADNWGGRGSILIFPFVSAVLFIFMTVASKFPHIHNFPIKVTEENAERLYSISNKLLTILKLEMIIFMAIGTYQSVQVAFGEDGIGKWYVPSLLIVIFLTLAIALYKMIRAK
jgi:uncharacterized membrane protein